MSMALDAPAPEITAAALQEEIVRTIDRPENGMPETSPLLLLDVREAEERAGGYIPNSLHIPVNWVRFRLNQLDKNAEIVVYCAHGVRSNAAAAFLLRQGYRARSLKGGIYAWAAAGGEINYG